METSMPLAANPVVSVLSSLSWNAARRMLNACTCGTWTPSEAPRATPPRRTLSPSSACDASEERWRRDGGGERFGVSDGARVVVRSGRRARRRGGGEGLGPGQGNCCSIQPTVVLTVWSVEGAWVSSLPSAAAAKREERASEERERSVREGRAETAARLVPGAGRAPQCP